MPYSQQSGRGCTMMFLEFMEQCMMIFVLLPGAVHQVFRGKYTSRCPAGMYCPQGLETKEKRVGSPLVNRE